MKNTALLLSLALLPCAAHGLVAGEPHRLYAQHRVLGAAVQTGNSMMTASIAAPEVNSALLDSSEGEIRGIPFEARLEGAYLFWSGSWDGGTDRRVDLTATDGARLSVQADACFNVNTIDRFYYCRADVTAQLQGHPGAADYNGDYRVTGLDATPGFINFDGTCQDPTTCQAKYAAWSLVLVYNAPSAPAVRDVLLYDGFRQFDETFEDLGIDQFEVSGFQFPERGNATLTLFGLEGDVFLGVPPQDTDPVEPCDTCFDYMAINGVRLSDATNPPNNLFNSSSPGGYTLGLDLDTFDISDRLNPGDQRLRVEIGSGDGRMGGTGGNGEAFFLGYVLLTLDSDAPNFQGDGTFLTVVPDAAAPTERVVYTLTIENEGTLDAEAVVARLPLPGGLEYVAGSLRVDGVDPIPGDEATNPLERGLSLGTIPHRGETRRVVTLRAAIHRDVADGARLTTRATLTTDSLEAPTLTNEATVTVSGQLEIGAPLKALTDLDGDGQILPDEVIQYRIEIPNPNDRPIDGVQLIDRLPEGLELLRVDTITGEDRSDPARGWVEIVGMRLPEQVGLAVVITARVRPVADLQARLGPAPWTLSNQAFITFGADSLRTDDPSTAAANDPTRFTIAADVDITGPGTSKRVEDLNGAPLRAGDPLRFTISVENTGESEALIDLDDRLNARYLQLDTCQIEAAPEGIACTARGVEGIFSLPAGERVEIVFTINLQDPPNVLVGDRGLENQAALEVLNDPGPVHTVSITPVPYDPGPAIGGFEKVFEGLERGLARPGQRIRCLIRFQNTGQAEMTGVRLSDLITIPLRDLDPGGGVSNGAGLEWSFPRVAPGERVEVSFEFTLGDVAHDTLLSNQATLTTPDLEGVARSDDPSTPAIGDPTTFRASTLPDLTSLEKRILSPEGEIRPGDTVRYQLSVTGAWVDATDVLIRDVIPFPVAAIRAEDGGIVEANNQAITWQRPQLAVGEALTLHFEVDLPEIIAHGTRLENQATIQSAELPLGLPSDDPNTPAVDDPTAFTVTSAPALTFTKDVEPREAAPGAEITYTFIIRNDGQDAARGVAIVDPLPDVFEPPAAGQLDGGTWRLEGIPELAEIPVGGEARYALPLRLRPFLDDGRLVDNQARVTEAEHGVEALSDDPDTAVALDPTRLTIRGEARARLTKTFVDLNGGEVQAGDVLRYTLQLENTGQVRLIGAVEDPLPDGLRPGEGWQARWDIPGLEGEPWTTEFEVTVDPGLAAGTLVANQARFIAGALNQPSDDPRTPEVDDPTTFTVVSRPDLSQSTKTAEPTVVLPGRPLTYTITIRNTGTQPALNVRVIDDLDGRLDDLRVQGMLALEDHHAEGLIPRLEPGEERAFTITARVALDAGEFTLSNQAQISADGLEVIGSDDPRTPAPNDPTLVEVREAPEIGVFTKTVARVEGPGPFRPGDRVRYTLSARNTGLAAAESFEIRDPIPEGIEGIQVVGGRIAGEEIIFEREALGPDGIFGGLIEGRIAAGAIDGSIISNQARLTYAGIAEPLLSDDPATAAPRDPTLLQVTAAARLVLEKAREGEGAVLAGARVTYTLSLRNEGDAPAAGVVLVDAMPEGLEDIQSAPPAEVDGRTLRWSVGDLPAGGAFGAQITARVPLATPEGAEFSNQAEVGEARSDDPSTPEAGDPTIFRVSNTPELRALKTVVGDFRPGGAITYQIEVTNTGGQAAAEVVIEDTLPASLQIIGARPPADEIDGARLVWRRPELAPGERVTLEIQAQINADIPDGAQISNQGLIGALNQAGWRTDDPSVDGEEDATTFTVIARPVLELRKEVRDENGGAFAPGDPIAWLLVVTNAGTTPAPWVDVIDVPPPEVGQARAIGGEIGADGIARWRIDDLAPGETRTLELRCRIGPDIEDGVVIRNEFGARLEGQGRYELAEVSLTVATAGAPRRLLKAVELGRGGARPGAQVLYRLTLVNEGSAPLQGVVIDDPVPVDLLDQIEPDRWGVFDEDRGIVTWQPSTHPDLGLVPPGGRVEVTFTARVRQGVPINTVVSNQALTRAVSDLIARLSDDPTTPAEGDPTTFTVDGGAELRITKRLLNTPAQIQANHRANYLIEITNIGNRPPNSARLTDRLAPGLTLINGAIGLDGELIPVGDEIDLNLTRLVTLEPGARHEIIYTAAVDEALMEGFIIENTARLSWEDGEVSSTTAFEVLGEPRLVNVLKEVSVVGGRAEARVGDTLMWQISFLNAGTGSARDLVLTDALAPGARYAPGTLTLDARLLSDALDGDEGEVIDGLIRVRFARPVAPSEGHLITFQTQLTEAAAPLISNQAELRAEGLAPHLSDDRLDDEIPARPTTMPVASLGRSLALTMRPWETPIYAGGAARVEVTLENTGAQPLTDLRLFNEIPAKLEADLSQALPAGGALIPAPEGLYGRGRYEIRVGDLPVGERRRYILNYRVDLMRKSRRLLDRVDIQADGDFTASVEEALPIELWTSSWRVTPAVALQGGVWLDPLRDARFEGWTARLYDALRPAAPPFEAALQPSEVEGEPGAFLFEGLPPGDLRLEVLTPQGVVLAQQAETFEAGAARGPGIVYVRPSGHLYHAVDVTPQAGARLTLYRDEDSDDDPFDAASARQRVRVDPEALESPTQQDQRVGPSGLYRFGVREAGRYILEITAPSSFGAPSQLRPPQPGYAPSDWEASDGDESTYHLAFNLAAGGAIEGQHVPLDPLSSLIQVSKRSRRPTTRPGEIVTYEVDITNRSAFDLIYDPRVDRGGVYLRDWLPKALKYIPGSSALLRIRDGREEAIGSGDPRWRGRELRFGRLGPKGADEGGMPFDLRAGEQVRLRYQAVVTAKARPYTRQTNRAALLAYDGARLSDTAEAEIFVLPDPDFDQGLLMGRVFCDQDGDGRQVEGERGLAGVKVFLDTGVYAITDDLGRYHLKDIDAGSHLVKVDARDLLPGAEHTTAEARVISFTRGLPAKVDFGVTCPSQTRSDPRLEIDGEQTLTLEERADEALLISGDLHQIRFGDMVYTLPEVKVTSPIEGKDLDPREAGPLRFEVEAPEGRWSRWWLWIGVVGGEERVVMGGRGPAPRPIEWRALDLEPKKAYTYRVEIGDEDGLQISSPAGVFGYGMGERGGRRRRLARVSAEGFDGLEVGLGLKRTMRRLRPKLEGRGPLSIEVHGGSARDTRRRAQALKRHLEQAYGLTIAKAIGRGDRAPLAPNITARNRRRNRRVEIYSEGSKPKPVALPQARWKAEAAVDRWRTPLGADGGFALAILKANRAYAEALIRGADGRRAVVRHKIGVVKPLKRRLRRVRVTGGAGGGLLVGGKPAPAAPQLTLDGPRLLKRRARSVASWAVKTEARPRAWQLRVLDAAGVMIHHAGGRGAVEAIRWNSADAEPGVYTLRLTLTLQGGDLLMAQARVRVGRGAAPPQTWSRGVWINGAALSPPETLMIGVDEAVLVERAFSDGRRALNWVYPPASATSVDAEVEVAVEAEPEGAARPARYEKLDGGAPKPRRRRDGAEPRRRDPYEKLDAAAGAGRYASVDRRGGRLVYQKLGPLKGAVAVEAPKPHGPVKARGDVAALSEAARAALARFGADKLSALLIPEAEGAVAAARLKVELPPAGATLEGRRLPFRGETAAGNRVEVNGQRIEVGIDGSFSGFVDLEPGVEEVRFVALDKEGNRGVITHPLMTPDSSFFLMAMGEGLGALHHAPDGATRHTTVRVGDALVLHGRAALYLKGYARGEEILGGAFKRYDVTAHLDTARRADTAPYFRQIVDPEAFYPVYGDDATEVHDAQSRGPLYVLVKADESRLRVGNFKADLRGVELFNYQRTLYGASVELNKQTGPIKHEIKAHFADLDTPERHAYVELRGTGGSLYYLPHRDLVEGSERVYLITRDRISGLELGRQALNRGVDYTARYLDGRLLMMRPIASVSSGLFGALPQPGHPEVLDGHPQYIAVEYDHRDLRGEGETAVAAHARETWGILSLGAGMVQEGRGGEGDYTLKGVDLKIQPARKTFLELEYAQSERVNAGSFLSEDGGLTFQVQTLDGQDQSGEAILIRGGFELNDLIGEGDEDWVSTRFYWQEVTSGFSSGGAMSQRALNKLGFLNEWRINEAHTLRLQHDLAQSKAAQPNPVSGMSLGGATQRAVTRLGHHVTSGPLKLSSEWIHTEARVEALSEPMLTDALSINAEHALDDRWTLLLGQEAVLRGSSEVYGDDFGELLTTTAGARYKVAKALELEAIESLRWSGDNATQIGARSQINDRHTLYAHERFSQERGVTRSTSVVGGEERLGKKGRAYGEYQLEQGSLGQQSRAVMGLGRKIKLTEKLHLDGAFEHSQAFVHNGGDFTIDSLSLGFAFLDGRRLKGSGRYELRYEDGDGEARRDKLQLVALNAWDLRLRRDLTLMARLNWSQTEDLDFEEIEAELMEASLGLAWRPVHHNRFWALFKAARRMEQRPILVGVEEPEHEISDVLSVVPVLELPGNFQLVEKVAYKRYALQAPLLPTQVSHNLLWINRLNYHLTHTWDIGGEYRYLLTSLAESSMHGLAFELNYIVKKRVRLGAGYNFAHFSDDEFETLEEDHHGPFLRIIGQY